MNCTLHYRSDELYLIHPQFDSNYYKFISAPIRCVRWYKGMGRFKMQSRAPCHALIVTAFLVYREQETLECTTAFFVFSPDLAGNSLDPLFDTAEFKSSYVQRAFQYLKLCYAGGQNLDSFCFVPGQVMGDHTECIEILTR